MQRVSLHIIVDERHIDAGEKTDNRHPLSLAILEAAQKTPPFQGHGLGAVEIWFITVGLFGVKVRVGTAEHWHVCRCDEMPDSAYEFIERYKTEPKQSVTSFSFTLMLDGSPLGSFECPGCTKVGPQTTMNINTPKSV